MRDAISLIRDAMRDASSLIRDAMRDAIREAP